MSLMGRVNDRRVLNGIFWFCVQVRHRARPALSPLANRHDPVFEDARLQPFLDQANHARVIDPCPVRLRRPL